MNHLVIRQNNGITEEVSNAIISKLYELAEAGLDAQSSVVGRVHVEKTYRHMVEALTGQNGYFPELYITKDNYIAYFEDPEVRSIFEAQYGELTETQLTNISSIGTTFKNSSIETFDELGKMTGVTSLDYDAFRGCGSLKSLDVSNIVTLNSSGGAHTVQTFANCSNLVNMSFDSLKWAYIKGDMFYGCSKLKSVTMPELLATTENNYNNNSQYKTIQVAYPFNACPVLEYVNFGKAEIIFEDPDQWHYGAFTENPALKIVECGGELVSMGLYSFKNTPNLKAVVINNSTTVPTVNLRNQTPSVANLFGGSSNCIIYVPQAMISVYQADPDWGALSANIQPIENYDKDAILAAS